MMYSRVASVQDIKLQDTVTPFQFANVFEFAEYVVMKENEDAKGPICAIAPLLLRIRVETLLALPEENDPVR